MNWMKLIACSAVIGGGVGFLIGRREVHNMAVQCDQLIEANKHLEQKCETLARSNDNYRRANQLFIELREKEAIVDDYDTWKKETEDMLAEESEQLVDEMSDEEYQETLAYIEGSELD